jgi:hypothetical protein
LLYLQRRSNASSSKYNSRFPRPPRILKKPYGLLISEATHKPQTDCGMQTTQSS